MFLLSERWGKILANQPETGMTYQIATTTLKDGRKFPKTFIYGGYVLRVGDDPNIPFTEDDIESILVDHGK